MTGQVVRSWAAVVAAFMVAGGAGAASIGSAGNVKQRDLTVLRRARLATGAEQAPTIRSLRVEGERVRGLERERGLESGVPQKDEFCWLLRPPSYFEQALSTVTHTVDGTAFRMSRAVDEKTRLTAEANTRWRSLEVFLLFLCRLPGTVDVEPRDLGIRTVEGITGHALEFSSRTTSLTMLFDEKTHLAVAQVFRRTDGVTPSRVHRVGQFRRVDGVLYPFRIEERFGKYLSVTEIRSIEVNGRAEK